MSMLPITTMIASRSSDRSRLCIADSARQITINGIKAFALSMIETAVELTEGRIAGSDIQTVISSAKEMLAAEIDLPEHVAEAMAGLADNYPLGLLPG
jgi:putative hydrolase of the HAD superfamily